MLDSSIVDPDNQIPLPFQAAVDYADLVTTWALEMSVDNMKVAMDVSYGPDRLNKYSVFAPTNAKNAPVVIAWHGGGWTNGYRVFNTFMAEHIVKMGYVLVAPSYRLVTTAKFPAPFDDSIAMLAHVHKTIAEFGGDPNALYLTGHSAGGHLCALTALRVADRVKAGTPEAAVRGCLPISGIMDMHHPTPVAGSLEARVYEMVLQKPEDDALMSPVCWTAGNKIPFVLTYGDKDSERVQLSNRRIKELLTVQPGGVEMHKESDTDHFLAHTMLRDGGHPWYGRLKRMVEAG